MLIKDGATVRLVSRNEKDLTPFYKRVVAAAQKLQNERVVLNGEIVALDPTGRPSFQSLQHRGANPSHPIVFYAFDLLSCRWPRCHQRTFNQATRQVDRDNLWWPHGAHLIGAAGNCG